jgi:hypothetical protein
MTIMPRRDELDPSAARKELQKTGTVTANVDMPAPPDPRISPLKTHGVAQPSPKGSIMKSSLITLALTVAAGSCFAGALALGTPASAQVPVVSLTSADLIDSPMLIRVADGCGPNGWRGPWGHCHWTHYAGGGVPYGYYRSGPYRVVAGPYWNRSCPIGYWRGPWGHCRNTPYHGRLPDGGYR